MPRLFLIIDSTIGPANKYLPKLRGLRSRFRGIGTLARYGLVPSDSFRFKPRNERFRSSFVRTVILFLKYSPRFHVLIFISRRDTGYSSPVMWNVRVGRRRRNKFVPRKISNRFTIGFFRKSQRNGNKRYISIRSIVSCTRHRFRRRVWESGNFVPSGLNYGTNAPSSKLSM